MLFFDIFFNDGITITKIIIIKAREFIIDDAHFGLFLFPSDPKNILEHSRINWVFFFNQIMNKILRMGQKRAL